MVLSFAGDDAINVYDKMPRSGHATGFGIARSAPGPQQSSPFIAETFGGALKSCRGAASTFEHSGCLDIASCNRHERLADLTRRRECG